MFFLYIKKNKQNQHQTLIYIFIVPHNTFMVLQLQNTSVC